MALTLALLFGCGGKPDLPIQVELDSQFTDGQIKVLEADFKWLQSAGIPSIDTGYSARPKLSQWFDAVFGGSDTQHVLKFIDDRSGYYLAPSRDVFAQIGGSTPSDMNSVIAMNWSVGFFYYSMITGNPFVFEFDGHHVRTDDTRSGIIQLNDGHFATGFARESDTARLYRLNVLVHEGRHSDCGGGGLRRSALVSTSKLSTSEQNACGHRHVVCPRGHEYSGMAACDEGSAWGAYAVSAVFMARMIQCRDCSEDYFQTGLAMTLDLANRILPNDQLFDGSKGMPDLSHTSTILEDLK